MWNVDLLTNGDREFVLRGWVTCQIVNGPRLSRRRKANKSFRSTIQSNFGPEWAFRRKYLFVRGFCTGRLEHPQRPNLSQEKKVRTPPLLRLRSRHLPVTT